MLAQTNSVDRIVARTAAAGDLRSFSKLVLTWCRYPLFAPKPEHQEKVSQWIALAKTHGVTLAAVAIAFGALPKCVTKVVMGLRSVEELDSNMAAMSEDVPPALWADAQAKGLLRPDLAFASVAGG